MKILFMCVANSARSQIAEGLAKSIFGDSVEIQSAGSKPSNVNPLAIEVMKEVGLDISKHHSKIADNLPPRFFLGLNYVITLCAEEVCPSIASRAEKIHWPLLDPAGHDQLSREEKLQKFRNTRDAIKEKLVALKQELSL